MCIKLVIWKKSIVWCTVRNTSNYAQLVTFKPKVLLSWTEIMQHISIQLKLQILSWSANPTIDFIAPETRTACRACAMYISKRQAFREPYGTATSRSPAEHRTPQSMRTSDSFELHSLGLLTIRVFRECDAVSSGFVRTCRLHHQGSGSPSAISLCYMTLEDSEGTIFFWTQNYSPKTQILITVSLCNIAPPPTSYHICFELR